ncbi:hypothetical protein EDB81DRAFT_829566 [Dactylonectria macrodidyma]|uniref:Uncharacterized protein n=1 Tax=Dactylonectria macrodidyma TaxID=307937 RepID=A0A9P9I976_9HYPO|nr:hypothetical protein EDB81DRAFT_829566 [Dactylonectria macrodidyma]
MSIDQIRQICRGILNACDQADPNEPGIHPELVGKLLFDCITIWETIPQETQRNIAKPLDSKPYAIIRKSTEASRSTKTKSIPKNTITKSGGVPPKTKPRTENTITIDEALLREFHSWTASPAKVFDLPSLLLEHGIVKYITNAEGANYVKDIRLRFVKWMFYRCRQSWGYHGKQDFLRRLEEDGAEVDERQCSRWLHHGNVYDRFVKRWGTGVLIIIPLSYNEVEKVRLSKKNDKTKEIFESLKRIGIQEAAVACATVGKAFEEHLLRHWKSVGLLKDDHATENAKRKSSITENQQAWKKSKLSDLACLSSSLDDHQTECQRCVTIHSTPEPEDVGMASRRSFECTLGPAAIASQRVVLRSGSTPHTLAEPEATDGPSPAPTPGPRQESRSHVPIQEASSSQDPLQSSMAGMPHQLTPSEPSIMNSTQVQRTQSRITLPDTSPSSQPRHEHAQISCRKPPHGTQEASSSQKILQSSEAGLPHQPAPSSRPNVMMERHIAASTCIPQAVPARQDQSSPRTRLPVPMAAEATGLSTGASTNSGPFCESGPGMVGSWNRNTPHGVLSGQRYLQECQAGRPRSPALNKRLSAPPSSSSAQEQVARTHPPCSPRLPGAQSPAAESDNRVDIGENKARTSSAPSLAQTLRPSVPEIDTSTQGPRPLVGDPLPDGLDMSIFLQGDTEALQRGDYLAFLGTPTHDDILEMAFPNHDEQEGALSLDSMGFPSLDELGSMGFDYWGANT